MKKNDSVNIQRLLVVVLMVVVILLSGCVTGEVVWKDWDPASSMLIVTPSGDLERVVTPRVYYLLVKPDKPVKVTVDEEAWDRYRAGDRYPEVTE